MSDLPEKLKPESTDIAADRVAQLREVMPEVFSETGIDWDALRRTLGEWVDPGKERFGLNWPGKADCMRIIQQPSVGTLLPMRDESVNFDETQNVIIEGDNLEVLKLLQKSYYGKVKMIYIDPPYNTGNEFIYPDNFKEGLQDYLRYSGQTDEEGFKLSANAETEGRYHSKWLNMMYPRLFLARNLLRDDGVIFVSIDDNEVTHLRSLCNEIFGEEAFLGCLVWQSKKGGGSDNGGFVQDHEYVLAYGQSRSARSLGRREVEAEPLDKEDEKGPYRRGRELNKWGSNSLRSDRPTMYFSVNGPEGELVYPVRNDGKEGCWRWGRSAMERAVADGDVEFVRRENGSWVVYEKVRSTANRTKPYRTWLTDAGATADGTKALKALFNGEGVFPYPKPPGLLQLLLTAATSDGEGIVLDFFAGSGSAADAVVSLNHDDDGTRQFILVQLPEEMGDSEFATVAELTRARMRRVFDKVEADSERGLTSFGFRSYRLSSSNFRAWNGENDSAESLQQQLASLADNTVEGRSEEDILTELLLKAGFELTAPVEELPVAGKTVFSVADGALLLSLDGHVTVDVIEEMVQRDPQMIICLDEGFRGNDELKVNAVQTVEARNRNAESDIMFRVV